jgi:hypothetical protein
MRFKDLSFLLLVVVLIASLVSVSMRLYMMKHPKPAAPVACTMDALVCPDGSAVGRTGPRCAFAACQSKGSLTGLFLSDAQGDRLAVPAPEGGSGASYAVPLDLTGIELEGSTGKTVTLSGSFTEGNKFKVTGVVSVASTTGDMGEGIPAVLPLGRVPIKLGETKYVEGLKLTLLEVSSDSRCPEDVQCIQAGSVTTKVSLVTDTDRASTNIVSGGKPFAIDTFTVSLIEVSPKKKSTVTVSPKDYLLTFLVEPLPMRQ